ncbi:MAG: hypothetical protein ACFFB2_18170 [Promethearchaeota archaeon]
MKSRVPVVVQAITPFGWIVPLSNINYGLGMRITHPIARISLSTQIKK